MITLSRLIFFIPTLILIPIICYLMFAGRDADKQLLEK